MENFDPYHQWLGISPAEQPPDHYRLLGIRQFEDDPTVIENAADRQMIHLKTFQTGPRSVHSQRLLNEVAAARVCLLSPEKKDEYDRRIRQSASGAAVSQSETFPQADQSTIEDDETNQALQALELADRIPHRRSYFKRHLTAAFAILVATVFVFVLLGISVPEQKSKTVVVSDPAPKTEAEVATEHETTTEPKPTPGAMPESEPPSSLEPPPMPENMPEAEAEPETTPIPNSILESEPAPESESMSEPESTVEPESTSEPESTADPEPTVEVEPKPKPSGPKEKQAVPSTVDQNKLAKVMEEAYDFDKANTPEARIQLARRLNEAAVASADGGEAFVLLNRSAELAADGGDPELVFSVIDEIGSRYKTDATVLGTKLLKRYAATITTPEGLNTFAAVCKRCIDDYLAEGRYASALDSAKMIYQSTLKLRNKDFRKQVLAVHQAVAKLYKEHQACRQAEEKLAQEPDDAQANLIAGRWYCFRKHDYGKGLPLLAKSGAGTLAAVAKKDTEFSVGVGSETAEKQVAVGDAWWKLAEKAKGTEAIG
ncbi:MAG: hypothetical protein JXM70_20605, partial [Pirellulales bacterium]|nr:hypothetical protein [Pirellulales bacterium]